MSAQPTPISTAVRAASFAAQQQGQRLTLQPVLEALLADGWIAPADIDQAVRYVRMADRSMHPLVAVAEAKLRATGGPRMGTGLSLEVLTDWLASKVGLPYQHIDPLRIDFNKVGDVVTSTYASRYSILPIEVRPNEVVVATCEPFITDWVGEVAQIMRRGVKRVVANPNDIARYIVEFYNLARSVKSAAKRGGAAEQQKFEQLVQMGNALATQGTVDQNDAHVVQIVDWLWQYAFDQRASDIHLEPKRDIGLVRFRIDGVLHQVYQVPATVMAAMVARVKLLGRMDVVEKRRPLDGRIKTKNADGDEVELRLSTLPTAFGEKLVMRIFDPEVIVRDFAQLGFSADDSAKWQSMTSKPHGIILVTGPTGSGKTTTLYAALTEVNTGRDKIVTIEDPVEYQLGGIVQIPVNEKRGLTFARGLRSILRHDPDKIMVGEIRDAETAQIAVQAALTGHLVFTTVHANSVFDVIGRFTNMGVDAYSFVSALNGIVAQRLLRLNCPQCSEPYAPTEEQLRHARVAPPAQGYTPQRGRGCGHCRGTGYKGRKAIAETLPMTDRLRDLMSERAALSAIKQEARSAGIQTLRQAAVEVFLRGETTLEEVNRVTQVE